jgi:hypothetical protein
MLSTSTATQTNDKALNETPFRGAAEMAASLTPSLTFQTLNHTSMTHL